MYLIQNQPNINVIIMLTIFSLVYGNMGFKLLKDSIQLYYFLPFCISTN